MRRTIAELLISITDGNDHMAHCGQKFETRDALLAHQEACDFRVMGCTHDGCAETFSAKNESVHDDRCPHKVLACIQECGQRVKRMDMDDHTTGPCGRKMVQCPLESIGCHAAMFAEDLMTHCNQSAHRHLTLAVELISTQQGTIGSLQEDLGAARGEIRATAAALTALQAGSVTELSSDSKKMVKQIDVLTTENKKMKKRMDDMAKDMKKLQAFLADK